jgi:hypothetical protein
MDVLLSLGLKCLRNPDVFFCGAATVLVVMAGVLWFVQRFNFTSGFPCAGCRRPHTCRDIIGDCAIVLRRKS